MALEADPGPGSRGVERLQARLYDWRLRSDPQVQAFRGDIWSRLGYQPHPGQVAVHRSPARYRVVTCGTKWGKTTVASMEAIGALLTMPDSRGWIVAPTYALTRVTFRQIYWTLMGKTPGSITKESETRMFLRTELDSEVQGMSAEDPDKSLLAESLDWLIIDEAPRVREEAWTAFLRERLTDREGWAMFIGTPKGRNWYHRLHLQGHQNPGGTTASFSYPSTGNPHINPAEVEAARREIPDRVFRQEYQAEFLSMEGAVFRWARELAGTCALGPPERGRTYTIGADLAKHRDYFVLLAMDENGRVCHFDRFQRVPWPVAEARLLQAARDYGRAQILLDATGVGDPVLDHLRQAAPDLQIDGFVFTPQSKRALLDNLAVLGEKRAISYPDIPELVNELEAFEWTESRSGNFRLSAPQGGYDDCVMALALAAWARGPIASEPWIDPD